MNRKFLIILVALIVSLAVAYFFLSRQTGAASNFITYQVDLQKQDLRLYWKNEKGERIKTLGNLKDWLGIKNQELVFAMNAGMFKTDHSPQGFFIERAKVITPLDTGTGGGNFYLKPNGVFYITIDKRGGICKTEKFENDGRILYATQSGPMLVMDGKIHPAFKQGSTNLNIRNGVGLLPSGQVVFAMSKKEVNFCDFASYFKQLGCLNALYLDGFVSRTYLPEQNWVQTDGNFGVIIGVTTYE